MQRACRLRDAGTEKKRVTNDEQKMAESHKDHVGAPDLPGRTFSGGLGVFVCP